MILRFFQKILAIFILIMISPLLLFIGLLISIFDGRPVFFTQLRVGKDEKKFKMYKFRTMKKNTHEISKNDFKDAHSQITSLGKFLRKYSLDELPQLLNIIRGNMTFIGYRPGIVSEVRLNELRKKNDVFKYLPGVTGWAQVNGRDHITIDKKVALDSLYYKNKSFLLKLKIIVDTFYNVLSKKNILH